MGIEKLYLDLYQFTGIVACSRVYKTEPKRYIHFLTLGVGEGEYVDVIVDSPVKYSPGSVISGQGHIKTRDNSQYIHCRRKNVKVQDIRKHSKISESVFVLDGV